MAKALEQIVRETMRRFQRGGAGGPKALMMDPVVTIFPSLQEHDERMSFVDPSVAVGQPEAAALPPLAQPEQEEDFISLDAFQGPIGEPELPEGEPVVGPNIPGEGAGLRDVLL